MIKLAFVFPGQGSQFIGMCKNLYDNYDIAKKTFDEADEVLGFSISNLCFNGKMSELNKLENLFPALLVAGVVSYRVYMSVYGITPQFLAGHSLGEYTALTCSGAIKFSDALKLVQARGRFADEIVNRGKSGMTIIENINKDIVESECNEMLLKGKKVWPSCYNTEQQTAICGMNEDLIEVENILSKKGATITPLFNNAAFHCPLMDEISDKLSEELDKYSYYYIRYPVLSNVTGLPYNSNNEIKDNLLKQITHPVKWISMVEYMQKIGITHVIEMSPKNMMANIVKSTAPEIECLCFGKKSDRERLDELILKDEQVSKHIPTVVTKCLAAAVATPNSNWDEEQYNEGVIIPYKKIEKIQEEIEQSGVKPTLQQMKEALDLLKTIFTTKKVSEDEQYEWKQEILDETGTRYLLD
ncbi:MAG: ACP S-malonyltransferase [Clostridium sp.]